MNTQIWINEFLFTRALFKGPVAKPLYTYQVTEQEYFDLVDLLKTCNLDVHPASTKPHYTAACFALFVAEYYRRFYEGNYSWEPIAKILNKELNVDTRSTLTIRGLDYWHLDLKRSTRGNQYLDSLFAQGGLPLPVISHDKHAFGRAINRGINNFYRSDALKRSLTDLMLDHQNELPQSFQNFETIQLLSAIVHQLMDYAHRIPKERKEAPADFLDQTLPDWNKTFPIPLDIANGRKLINEWLTDAVKTEGAERLAQEKRKHFTAEHKVLSFLPLTQIESILFLPKHITLEIEPSLLSTMRFETAVFEGERLALKSLAVYGQKENNVITVKLSITQLSIKRKQLDTPVIFRLLENGRPVFSAEIEGSALDVANSPLVLELENQDWNLVSTASCNLKACSVRTLLPEDAEIEIHGNESDAELIGRSQIGTWYQLSANHAVTTAEDKFIIRLKQNQQVSPFKLSGLQFFAESTPQTVFMGMPKLIHYNQDDATATDYREFVNGTPKHQSGLAAGIVNYQVKDSAGHTLYRRQFGLLPKDFVITTRAAAANEAAVYMFETRSPIKILNETSPYYAFKSDNSEGALVEVKPKNENSLPSVLFKISSDGHDKALHLRLPFPSIGVRLLTPDNQVTTTSELLLNELTGYRLILSAPNLVSETFRIRFSLHNRFGKLITHTKKLKTTGQTETISLYAFMQDITQLLSVTDDQDAYVQLQVVTHKTWLTLNLRRYNAKLFRDSDITLAVQPTGFSRQLVSADDDLYAMRLSEPEQEPLRLDKQLTENVPTGLYLTEKLFRQPDLWLIFAQPTAKLSFRPFLFVTLDPEQGQILNSNNTLHSAALSYHPKLNPDAFSHVITLMASDYHHSGWQYLTALKQNFAHLPLSTFEAWKALAQNPKALALAIFRLELDESFCVRIRDELAVIFETIPLEIWVVVRKYFKSLLKSAGLPEVFVDKTVKDRDGVMRMVVSGFDHITEYLDTGLSQTLKVPPLEVVLPIWYQQLRQVHADDQWPESVKTDLRNWLDTTELPDVIKRLTHRDYTDSVTYLPIFMAYLTMGLNNLSQLNQSQALVKYFIKEHAEFDKRWYQDVHALMVAHLTKNLMNQRFL